MILKLKVEGMSCGGCEKRIINSLSTIETVTKVEASYKEKTVTIESKDDVFKKAQEKITDLGFELVK